MGEMFAQEELKRAVRNHTERTNWDLRAESSSSVSVDVGVCSVW